MVPGDRADRPVYAADHLPLHGDGAEEHGPHEQQYAGDGGTAGQDVGRKVG